MDFFLTITDTLIPLHQRIRTFSANPNGSIASKINNHHIINMDIIRFYNIYILSFLKIIIFKKKAKQRAKKNVKKCY